MNIRSGQTHVDAMATAKVRRMTVLGVLPALCVALSLGAWTAPAAADPFSGPKICSSPGTAISGSHDNLTLSGNSYVADGTTLTVNGNLTLAPEACLDAFTLGTVNVAGNVLVRKKAVLALGCSPGSLGPPIPQAPCYTTTTKDTVGGDVIALRAMTMYLDGAQITGNVISIGGGNRLLSDPSLSFPIKDNTIGGSLIVDGWQGAWFGVLRNTVGRGVTVSNNTGTRLGDTGQPDSTEIGSNTITGNLICLHNTPPAQIGDSPTGPNTVHGRKIGECKSL